MDTSNWITLVTVVGSIALFAGAVIARLKALEKKFDKLETKVDRHNCFMERIATLEQWKKDVEA
jgi:outer membrane murein-binding lipoprotein Lpp